MGSDIILNKVASFIETKGLIKAGDRILLSLSAGKDSMAMLRILASLAGPMGFTAGIFHLNHMMRGGESLADERFIEETAESMEVPLYCKRHDFTVDRPNGFSFEEYARTIRYRLLQETAVKEGYDTVATAHTRSDTIETILMRLFTGTGLQGLTGIPASRGNIIRPILCITTEEVLGFLKNEGTPWREDGSNSEVDYSRNFIRHRIIPIIRERFHSFEDSLLGTGIIAGEATAIIDEFVHEIIGEMQWRENGIDFLDVGSVLTNRPLLFHILAGFIRNGGIYPTRGIIEEIAKRYGSNRSHLALYENKNIRIAKTLWRGRQVLSMDRVKMPAAVKSWEYRIDINENTPSSVSIDELDVTLEIVSGDSPAFSESMKKRDLVVIAMDSPVKTLTIRNRRNGDRILTEGGTKKIKDFFIEKKLDTKSKDSVPLIIVNDSIAAIMTGLLHDMPNRVSSRFLVTDQTKKVLAIAIKNHYTMTMEKFRP